MISRRLTKSQKIEILEGYRAGKTANDLAEKYNCSSNTINRTVKTLISDDEYKLLKEKRSKINKTKSALSSSKTFTQEEDSNSELIRSKSILASQTESIEVKHSKIKEEDAFHNELRHEVSLALDEAEEFKIESRVEDQEDESNFEEIVPLVSSFGFETEKQQVDCQTLEKESLPETVYMLVDKKVELDSQSISDLPEWSFLPENEQKRQAIQLFPNQRSAKRNCSRNQRVIKIPNTSVFEISKSYLLSKGITRLILQDSLISLDN